MKILLMALSATIMVSFSSCGQRGKNVPSEVYNAFYSKFPDADKVKWDMENDSEWEAEFILNGVEYSANFDLSGTWMETEYQIDQSDIPATVKATLEAEFGDYSIEESEVVETEDGKVFEFELEKGKEELSVSIDMNGMVLENNQMEGDDRD